ncbi:N,N-dimethylformamidase beta subunit family domain-containing protein [Rufibacter roseus]|uniref:N,N-dimethylformamidase beta subunit family domain-containing protein n=1 Tax=Rufibacter roseus TaxID=1567108 RepID=A0ABW2DMR8_9BACT|nr:N,N-dimethylformamidase beta subunit family domain-containing protein [Rufibacter roseus]
MTHWLTKYPRLQRLLFKPAGKISFWRHQNRLPKLAPTAPDPVTPDMVPQPLEGYTQAHHYRPGQTIVFYLKAQQPQNLLQLQYLARGKNWETLAQYSFEKIHQSDTFEEAQQGCAWEPSWEYNLSPDAPQGYYRALLSNPLLEKPAEIHFIVGQAQAKARVAVLAPVTTWLAYNAYGGQSLYRNAIAPATVPYVSMHRPNTALTYKATHSMQHNLLIESNIFYWISDQFQADLLPDYYLQAHPELLQQYQVLVLAYHAEYFTQEMHQSLRALVFNGQKSLLALGGNQVYWQVKWHRNFTQIECRKDATLFQDSDEKGKLFRHTPQPEVQLFGCQFTEAGMGTYAPYQVVASEHWLYKGCSVKQGQIFGEAGVDGLPICGDETDKTTWGTPKNSTVLARGLNKTSAVSEMDVYAHTNPEWNGSGGGEVVFTKISEKQAILATGAIHSGAGLGHDKVFTHLIQNFMQKYAGTSSHGTTSSETAAAPAS